MFWVVTVSSVILSESAAGINAGDSVLSLNAKVVDVVVVVTLKVAGAGGPLLCFCFRFRFLCFLVVVVVAVVVAVAVGRVGMLSRWTRVAFRFTRLSLFFGETTAALLFFPDEDSCRIGMNVCCRVGVCDCLWRLVAVTLEYWTGGITVSDSKWGSVSFRLLFLFP